MVRRWTFVAGTLTGAAATALAVAILLRSDWVDWQSPSPAESHSASQDVAARSAPMEANVVTVQVPPAVPAPSKPTAALAREEPRKPERTVQWDALVSGTVEDALKPDRSAEWDALVSGMLEYEVGRRFGRRLDLVQQQRLLDTLAQLRHASLGLQEEPGDAGSSAALRERLSRTLAILQADRVFREEIGIGVSEFLEGLDADAVEDVAPARTNR